MKPNSPGCQCCDPVPICVGKIATTFSGDSGGGGIAWTDPGNAGIRCTQVGIGTEAKAVLAEDETSEYLKSSNFGLIIPSGKTIVSVTALVLKRSFYSGGGFGLNDTIFDQELLFVDGGISLGINHAETVPWPYDLPCTGYHISQYDGTTDTTWDGNNFSDGNGFEIWLSAHGGTEAEGYALDPLTYRPGQLPPRRGGGTAFVEAIYAKVCYIP